MTLSKPRILEAFKRSAEDALEAAERAQAIATEEATSEQSKAEGKYDTRATEASYLARGQAKRVVELRALLSWYESLDPSRPVEQVSQGALVELDGDKHHLLLISPSGGDAVEVDGLRVSTISFSSPLGKALRGLYLGDDVELQTPSGSREFEIIQLL